MHDYSIDNSGYAHIYHNVKVSNNYCSNIGTKLIMSNKRELVHAILCFHLIDQYGDVHTL